MAKKNMSFTIIISSQAEIFFFLSLKDVTTMVITQRGWPWLLTPTVLLADVLCTATVS